MKVAVLNLTGNVGKTTIARDILKYNNPKFHLITVETINKDDKEDIILSAQNFTDICVEMMVYDDIVLDIGSSNIEELLAASHQDKTIFDMIDIYLVPVVPQKKQIVDTFKTIIELNSLGIDNEKIKVIFNMADPKVTLERQFNFEKFKKLDEKFINNPIVILLNKIYVESNIADLLAFKYSPKDLIAAKKNDIEEARKIAKNLVLKKQAESLIDANKKTYEKIING